MDKNRSTGNYQIKQDIGFGPLLCGLLLVSYVAFGAFGAHALEDRLTPDQLDVYETATTYHQLFAVLALIVLIGRQRLAGYGHSNSFRWGLRLTAIGFLMFCGSLYLLSTRAITGFGQAYVLGPITPLGGLLIMLGLALTCVAMFRLDRSSVG